ncbi:hypothetical protein LXT21_15780 [Myxococcus sp. K38C18041901]|uniref:hypothetical protein n=1 Tax=Myxococcus guangdongensis TaxID=2906760 RepID=UPI0020A8352E|nr:hypothetical protein [Myxococcus guangdongensis]MCP3060242.1 hypothetical protein [Myxococcus guangdongensis]
MMISGFAPAAAPNAVGLFLFECERPLTAYQRSELLREMRELGFVRASAWGLERPIDERRRWFGTGGWLPHLDVEHATRTRDLHAFLERHRVARAWFVQTTTVYPALRTVDPLQEPVETIEPLGFLDDEAHVHVVVITERKWFTYGPGAKLQIERRRRITLGEYEDEGEVVFESAVRPESGYRYFLRDGVLVRQRLRTVIVDDDDIDDPSADAPVIDASTPIPDPPSCPFKLSGYHALVERLPYEMETNGELSVEIKFASTPDEEHLEIVDAFLDLWAAQYPPGRGGPPWRHSGISCKGKSVRFWLDRFAPPSGRADEHVDRILAIMNRLHEHLPIVKVSF